MTDALLPPERAAALRRASLALAALAGTAAGAWLLGSQATVDFLREGPARLLPLEGGALRPPMAAASALAAIAAAAALWRGVTVPRLALAAAALGAGMLLVHVVLAPAAGLVALAAAADGAGRLTRERLASTGPRRYPLRWAAGAVAAAAGLAVLGAASWYLASPLFDAGTRLDEDLGFAVAGLDAPAAPAPQATPVAEAASAPEATPTAESASAPEATPTAAAAATASAAAATTPEATSQPEPTETPSPPTGTPTPPSTDTPTPPPTGTSTPPSTDTPTPPPTGTPTPPPTETPTPPPTETPTPPPTGTPTPPPTETPTPPPTDTPTPPPTETPTPAPGTGQLIAMGPLEGADSFHTASGRVLLVRAPDGRVILRFEDYAVRNGPDLYVYLTPDPGGDVRAAGAIEVSAVRATRGSVNYEVPPDADHASFRAAVIYCRPFQVTFATARLE